MTLGGKCLFFASPGSGVCSTFIRWSLLCWSDPLHTYFFVSQAVVYAEKGEASCMSLCVCFCLPLRLQLSPCTWGGCWVWIYDSYCYKVPLCSFMFFYLTFSLDSNASLIFLMKCLLLYDPHCFFVKKTKKKIFLFDNF